MFLYKVAPTTIIANYYLYMIVLPSNCIHCSRSYFWIVQRYSNYFKYLSITIIFYHLSFIPHQQISRASTKFFTEQGLWRWRQKLLRGYFKIGTPSYLTAHNVYGADKLKNMLHNERYKMHAIQNCLPSIFVNINDNKTAIEKLRNRKR